MGDAVVQALEDQVGCYRRLAKLAELQHVHVQQEQTDALLEEITVADQHDALVLQQRKLNVGKQINQATAAKKVNRNYAASAYGTPQSRMNVQR